MRSFAKTLVNENVSRSWVAAEDRPSRPEMPTFPALFHSHGEQGEPADPPKILNANQTNRGPLALEAASNPP